MRVRPRSSAKNAWLLSPPSMVLLFSRPEMPRNEMRPKVPSGVDRQVVDRGLVDVGREVLLLRVDDGRFARHLDGLLRAGDAERDVDGCDAADLNDDLLLGEGGKARGVDHDGVVARVELHDAEAALVVGRGRELLVGLLVLDGHGGVRDDGALRVFDRAADGALGRGLRPRGRRAHDEAEDKQGQHGG
jgi:hypothetical protein